MLLYMLGKYSAAELLTPRLGGCASIRMGIASSVFRVWKADVAVGSHCPFLAHPVSLLCCFLQRPLVFTY